jgi:hypothetical protein
MADQNGPSVGKPVCCLQVPFITGCELLEGLGSDVNILQNGDNVNCFINKPQWTFLAL